MQWFKRRTQNIVGNRLTNAQLPEGTTVYAIGDIHGRLDLLNELLDLVAADINAAKNEKTILIFLGDYIDRGPNSRLVIETLAKLKEGGVGRVVTLKGNHEAALLSFLDNWESGPAWAEHGGRETLLSYGIDFPRNRADVQGWSEARDQFLPIFPAHHLQFLHDLRLFFQVGDYVFAHAGVRPGVLMNEQVERDLLWIRKDFLEGKRALKGLVVVHGHTPTKEPSLGQGRIGIDTGAYATGVLTALRLRGVDQSFIQTGGPLSVS